MKTCPSCRTEAPDDAGACSNCGKLFDQPEAVAAAPSTNGPGSEATAKATTPVAPAAQEITLMACPQCKTAWEPAAVVCMTCGYDARIGRQLSTVRGVEDEPPIVRPATGYGPVRAGLVLHLVVVSLWLFSIPLSIILVIQRAELATLLESAAQGGELEHSPFIAALVMTIALIVLAVLQWMLGLIGSALCLWIPRESKARGWLVASLVLGVAVVPVGIAIVWFNWPAMLLSGLWLPSWVAWIMSLRSMAYYLQRRDEAQDAVGILVQMLIVLFVIPGIGFPALFFAVMWMIALESFACIGVLVGVSVGTLAFVGWLIYYVRVLFSLFQVIQTLRQEMLPKPSETAGAPVTDNG